MLELITGICENYLFVKLSNIEEIFIYLINSKYVLKALFYRSK